MVKSRKPFLFENPVCAEIGGDLFFHDDFDERTPDSLRRYRMAQKICSQCLHVRECAEWGIKYEYYGIWGGLDPQERRLIRKKRKLKLAEETLDYENKI